MAKYPPEHDLRPSYEVIATQLLALRELMETKLANIENNIEALASVMTVQITDVKSEQEKLEQEQKAQDKRLHRLEGVARVAIAVTITIVIPALFIVVNALVGYFTK